MFAGQSETVPVNASCNCGPWHKAQHACSMQSQTARRNDRQGCTPEESRGEEERGDSAWEDMDRGEVLPDITGPSCACMWPTQS